MHLIIVNVQKIYCKLRIGKFFKQKFEEANTNNLVKKIDRNLILSFQFPYFQFAHFQHLKRRIPSI